MKLCCSSGQALALAVLLLLPQIGLGNDAAVADDRQPIAELYATYESLVAQGWTRELIAESQPAGTEQSLPIIALRSPKRGPALWILAGVHGEEPAGPLAIAAAIESIAVLGKSKPVVLMPLLNPQGYARNWRYLNTPTWSADVPGQSVGDSSWLLPASDSPGKAREVEASSLEAQAITSFVLRTSKDYPPLCSVDLHEDNLISEGYVYSQGEQGSADPLAAEAVAVLREHGIAIKQDGNTRFDEPISGGIIGPVEDGSIDELMSAVQVVVDNQLQPGPAARTVLVIETPAGHAPLAQRVAAQAAWIRRLTERMKTGD